MFKRILIANRGEIALRIIRTCKELGIETVAVYSEADKDANYLNLADESICIGPAPAIKSYLDISRIISAAEITDVSAIHPGYGFLAENSHFAEVCESCNIDFIGPNYKAMELLGNKAVARSLARKLNIPVLPGSEKTLVDENEALEIAHKIGYPVMLKASAGGGGKGMRLAHNDVSLVKAFVSAKTEAEAAFKNSDIYIEKYIENARHIEIQILADEYGNVVYLGERDCSLQRKHQKLIEECPSPVVQDKLREKMGIAAIALAKAANYTNAGTVEFLLDEDENFYFIEMNTRIQVEHCITELITGYDLVAEQIKISNNEKLSMKQDDIVLKGCAIECRINAESPQNDFKPFPGKITHFIPPGGKGIRVDTHVYTGYVISPFYDSLISKLISFRETRYHALMTMRRALNEFVIQGVETTLPLCKEIFGNRNFLHGNVNTSFVENYFCHHK